MENHVIKGLTGSEGILTFNFFCESIIGSMHNLLHTMEHESIDPPKNLSQLPEKLSKIGTDLMADYSQQTIDLDRLKNQLLDFYAVAFDSSDTLCEQIGKGNDEMKYFYFVFEQGIKLLFPNLMDNIVSDLPDHINKGALMREMMQAFAAAAETSEK